MSARNELAVRARNVGLDPTTYTNDSKLEQKVLWLEKNGTTFAGTLGSGTLTSDNTNVSDGDTVTVGNQTYTFRTNLTGAKASGTLTSDATAPSDGDSVTIEGQTYVFRTALTNTVGAPYEVLIGASAAAALDNLKSAINADGTAVYGTGTLAHPLVTATTNTDTTQLIVAKSYGTAPNLYQTIETSAHLSFGATTLTGGAANVPNEVHISTTNADGSLTNLVSAINGAGTAGTDYDALTSVNQSVTAAAVGSHATVLTAVDYNVTNASVATTETSSHLSFGSTALASGVRKALALDNTTVNGSAGLSGDKDV